MHVTNGLFLSGKGYKTIGIAIKNSTGIKPVPKGNKLGWTRVMIERHEREREREREIERERERERERE